MADETGSDQAETWGTRDAEVVDAVPSRRSGVWVWWVSILLLLATMLNYMDRQALSVLSKRITTELQISNERYGDLEFGFGTAFAAGSLVFGILADRFSVRLLYPLVLLAWSGIGVLTGFCEGFGSLLMCRLLLGFFEAGHWPCALRTTQTLQTGSQRLMGNSVLQSGGALGAIITPLIILALVGGRNEAGAWRFPFVLIGSSGVVWAVLWLISVRRSDLPAATAPRSVDIRAAGETAERHWLLECLTNPRFYALVPVVIFLNMTWQLIRAWLPKFLQEGRGVSESTALYFNSLYFVAADIGCLCAGAAALYLARRGMRAQGARVLIFAICGGCTALATVAAMLPAGPLLYGTLLIVAAGSLGLFPCYYSMAQEVSERHLGKASGLLGAVGWLVSSPTQKWFGRVVDETGSFDLGLGLVGLAPLLGLLLLVLIWRDAER